MLLDVDYPVIERSNSNGEVIAANPMPAVP